MEDRRFWVFIVNFKHTQQIKLLFVLLTSEHLLSCLELVVKKINKLDPAY